MPVTARYSSFSTSRFFRGKAFTMVELLVVLLILSTLVTMVIGVGRYLAQEQDRQLTRSYQANILGAINIYVSRHGAAPPNPLEPPPGGTYANPMDGIIRPDGLTDAEWEIYARNSLLYSYLESDPQCLAIINELPGGATVRGQLNQPAAFLDAYGKYMDYREKGAFGGPLIVSGGPDGYIGGEYAPDDIRSDGKTSIP